MRHGYFGRNLSRPVGKRQELFKSLLNEVVRHGKIETTVTKAKAVQGDLDKLINMAKKGTVTSRARLEKSLTSDIAKKLFQEAKDKIFDGRNSGYSRIVKLGRRFSDDTQMAELELIKAPSHKAAAPEEKPEVKAEKVEEPPAPKRPRRTKKDE